MAINFPSSPTLNQQTTLGNVTYVFNGTGWVPAGTSTGISSVVTTVNGLTGNAVLTTDNIAEGTNNKYFSTTRFDQRLTAVSINLLSDVDTTTITPTDGMSLVYKASTLRWEPLQLTTGVSAVNNKSGNVTLTLANIAGVDLTTAPVNGQALVYNSGTGVWTATTPTSAVGGNSDQIFYTNQKTITANYTLSGTVNALTSGPVTINDGIVVTISDGATWSIV
jgi:hypothetical protein